MENVQWALIGGIALAVVLVVAVFLAILYRKVVSTNTMHIVQSRRTTTPYGTGQDAGNVYYKWPSWVPRFGVTVIELPVSNFDLSLKDYEAYDKDRVPFKVDVTSFFRIKDTALAAQRVSSVEELDEQLSLIVQGAVRKILASDVIDAIMLERSKFGEQFTSEVSDQLAEWGVESVKSMELMDIRDSQGSRVIANIMAKKISFIEMQSRTEVATNMKTAQTAEIEAQQAVDIRQQEALQAVGERTAEKDKAVGIAQQKSRQEVLTEEKETKTRDMAVVQVEQVRQAEITKEKEIVAAEQDKQTTIIIADGHLEAKRKEAQGIEAVGAANGAAAKAMQMATVEPQIVLAKEIGGNEGYQSYLISIEGIKAYQSVGIEQAGALKAADIKVIANTGKPSEGVSNVMDLFTSKGGTDLASAVEGFSHTPVGKAVLARFGVATDKAAHPKGNGAAPPATEPESAPLAS